MKAGDRDIITTENDDYGILRKVSSDITEDDAEVRVILKKLYDRVYQTRYDIVGPKACGIALPQVGISKRGFVINGKYGGRKYGAVFINPVMTKHSETTNVWNEQCLSEPWVDIVVERYDSIKLRYETIDWEEKHRYFEWWIARVLQHELDHLDGILLSDKPKNNDINEKSEKSVAI